MIIGFSGLAGSGKDTAADFAVREGFAKVALADEIKRIAQKVYGFSEQALWGPSAERSKPDALYPREEHVFGGGQACLVCGFDQKQWPYPSCYLTPRYALQLLGTEWGRACYPDTWVNTAIRHAVKLIADAPSVAYCGPMGVHERSAGCNVASAHSQITRCGSANEGVVFSDIRFLNEMEAVRKNGGKLVRLKRGWPSDPKTMLSLIRGTGGSSSHPSEVEQLVVPDDYFDIVIDNRTFESTEMLKSSLAKHLGW